MLISVEKAKRLCIRPWVIAIFIGWLTVFTGGILLRELVNRDIPLCVFKLVAGIPCPVCGSMRLVSALGRGEIGQAFMLNPMVFCAGLTASLLLVLRLGFGRTLKIQASPKEILFILLVGALLLVANWIYLIVDGR